VVKVLLTLIVVWAGLRLWPQFVLLLISLLLAVALHPVVTWLERRGLGRGVVVGLMTLFMCAVAAVLVTVVFTSLAEQLSKLVQDFSRAARSRRAARARGTTRR
jgi:predicted PurR-regulated permease PerM